MKDMKKIKFFMVVFAIIGAGAFFFSCQKEKSSTLADEPVAMFLKSNSSQGCDCVEQWTGSTATLDGWVKKNSSGPVISGLKLLVWNDKTTVHYKIISEDLTFTKVLFNDDVVLSKAGSTEYSWDVAIASVYPDGWVACDVISTNAISFVGLSPNIGTTNAVVFTYGLREICTHSTLISDKTNPVCAGELVNLTATVVATESITAGTLKIIDANNAVKSSVDVTSSNNTVSFAYTAVAGDAPFKAVYTGTDGFEDSESNTFTVTANPLPTATISGDATVNFNMPATLHVSLTGTGPWNIEYTGGSVEGVTENITDIEIIPPGTGIFIYFIENVYDANCQNTGSGSATIIVEDPVIYGESDLPESFTYSTTDNMHVVFTYESPVDITGAALKFTCPQIDNYISNDGKTYSPNPGQWNGSDNVLTWTGDITAFTPITFDLTFVPHCVGGGGNAHANVWTDFTVAEVSKKTAATPIIVYTGCQN
jgi:hypothetical protein